MIEMTTRRNIKAVYDQHVKDGKRPAYLMPEDGNVVRTGFR